MRPFLRLFLLLSVTTFPTLRVTAQSSPNDFLLTAFEDPTLIEYQNQISFLHRKNYRLPVIEELEVRYGNDERTFEDAQYQLRIRPSNPWKIRRNNALFNARKEAITVRQALEFKEALFERYSLMLEYLLTAKKVEIHKKKLELSQRKIRLFEQTLQSDLFDARDYVDAKLESIEAIEGYDEQQVEMSQLGEQIQLILLTDQVNWQNFALVSPAVIETKMNEIFTTQFNSAELTYLQQQVEVAQMEIATEKADFDIGFIQAEYAPFQNNDDNQIGVSFGVTIPIFRNNKDQIAERMLDEIEQKGEFEAEAYRDSLNKALETNFLTNYLAHHTQLIEEIEKLNIDKLSSNLAISADFDPITMLELEEGKLKLDELLVRSKERLLEHFLDFLYAFDALQQQPLQNYLSNDLSFIE